MNTILNKFIFAKEAWIYIICLPIIAGCLVAWKLYFVAGVPVLIWLFLLFFFRNPPRKISAKEDEILSPADGKVMYIEEIEHDEFIGQKAIKISIFLSVFNVHINRLPIGGRIIDVAYRPGKFLPAFKSHASEINERNTIVIENDVLTVAVHQLTGFLARRIVCFAKKYDKGEIGDRYGLIEFGSCTELILPVDRTEVKVKPKDVVRGGKTVLATIQTPVLQEVERAEAQ